jgi:hypothetical protein
MDTLQPTTHVVPHSQKFWIVKGIILFVLITLILSISMPAIERQLSAWKLLPGSQSLTELYFTDPKHLPSQYEPGQALLAKFVIGNHNVPSGTFHYTITESNTELTSTKDIASGTVYVKHDATAEITKPVTPLELGSQVYISVEVNNVTIGYWVTQG